MNAQTEEQIREQRVKEEEREAQEEAAAAATGRKAPVFLSQERVNGMKFICRKMQKEALVGEDVSLEGRISSKRRSCRKDEE